MSSYNLLLADNELSNLKALERTLRTEYNVFSATRSEDILILVDQKDISVVIANYRMPGITDFSILKDLFHRNPNIVFIILAAYADEKLLVDAINEGRIYGYVTKPWEPEEIKAIVKEGIETYEVMRVSRMPYIRVLLHSGIITKEQLENALQTQNSESRSIGDIMLEHGMITENRLNMAIKLQESKQQDLESILIELGDISTQELDTARALQRYERKTLSEIIVELEYADEESIFSCYALQLGMPYLPISLFSIKTEIIELLPADLIYRYTVFPLDTIGQILMLAALEPLSDKAINEIEDRTEYKLTTLCTSHEEIRNFIGQKYRGHIFWN